MTNKYIIIGTGQKNNVLNEAFYEVINNKIKNASFADPYSFNNKIIKKLYNFRYSNKCRKIFRFMPNSLWNHYSVLNNIEVENDEKLFLLFVIGRDVERLYTPELLYKIKQKFGDKVCTTLILFDSIDVTKSLNGWGKITECFSSYDKVATFDLNDEKKYGLIHFWDPYARRGEIAASAEQSDMFFIGVDKGRLSTLTDIAKNATNKGLVCDFKIFDLKTENKEIGIKKLPAFLPYDQMLSYAISSNCLVEILADGQSSSSFRYYEAVVYNKKLLTNNPNVKDMPFYDSKYIQYFDDTNSIDYDWIKDNSYGVDFKYNNEFSILRLFDKLE